MGKYLLYTTKQHPVANTQELLRMYLASSTLHPYRIPSCILSTLSAFYPAFSAQYPATHPGLLSGE